MPAKNVPQQSGSSQLGNKKGLVKNDDQGYPTLNNYKGPILQLYLDGERKGTARMKPSASIQKFRQV